MISIANAEPYGDYPALTARAALAPIIHLLPPGGMVTLSDVLKLDGTIMPRRNVQVHILQITPKDWSVVTRSTPEGIMVKRIK